MTAKNSVEAQQEVAADVREPSVKSSEPGTPRLRSPIAELLRTLRGELTLRDVEKGTGIPNSYLSNLELSVKNPGMRTLTKLSKFYKVPLDELLKIADIPFIETGEETQFPRLAIMRAYKFVVSDPDLYQLQPPVEAPSFEARQYIVQLYEHFTGKKLL